MSILDRSDPEIGSAVRLEKRRQKNTINLIAAENYASRAVLEAQGSPLTNKYAEGYPHHRYYGGCEYVDVAEQLAIERALVLYKAEHANMQPHSGSQANMAAYFALLQPGDTVLAMSLAHGGHLTHGLPVNFSGKLHRFVSYGVSRETELLDYDEMERLAVQHRPKLIVAGASAYPRVIDFRRFRAVADRVGARLMVDMAHTAGLVAAGLYPSPVPHADIVTSTTHKTLRGPRGGFILCRKELAQAVDAAVFPGIQGGPLMHIIAAKAVAFQEASRPEFVDYQRAVLSNARVMGEELSSDGLHLVSGGTDSHLCLVDLSPKGITGQAAEKALEAVNIIVNKNMVPFDTRPPAVASGIRVGTPAITTRGFGADEARRVASLIRRVLASPDDQRVQREVRREVAALCRQFPIP
ncbi:MAG: glyA [Dehalococcoidia bacterium]|nr:glyA [Dehalococcoidia bacterium]